MGLAKLRETRRLTGTGPVLGRQEAAGWNFGLVWNLNDPYLRSKPGPVVGYLDPLPTLGREGITISFIYKGRQKFLYD